jgi:hypothetical protein
VGASTSSPPESFKNAVQSAIRDNGLIGSHHQLYHLLDALKKSNKIFAIEIIQKELYKSCHYTESMFITSGLRILGLWNDDQIR